MAKTLDNSCNPLKRIRAAAARWLDDKIASRSYAATGLYPIKVFTEDDVFIVAYPKSGITWFQNLASGVTFGVDPEYAPDTLIQELVPDVHRKRFYRRFRTPTMFKSHNLPTPAYRRVIYLLRDGRDAMVSYLHHLGAIQGKEIDFLRMVQTGEGLVPCKWHEHVEAWLANPFNARMLIIKYEDLQRDPVGELRRFCTFIDIERENLFLQEVAKKSTFEKMRRKEETQGWDNPEWPKDKPFVRRGGVGSYKDEMPVDVLEAFLHDAAETLSRCGYA